MDLTRFFLYTTLALITYLMLLAWQEDYPPLVNDGSADIAQLPTIPQSAGNPELPVDDSDLPSQVPAAPAPTADQVAAQQQAQTATSNAETIEISTDTLQLRIDLDGGDIIYAALPLYLKQLEVPDDPFVLLESTNNRMYVAQSGLIGRDGIDSNGRATYQTEQSSYTMSEGQDELVVDLYHTTADGVTVTKRYHFTRDSYLIDVSFIVENNSADTYQANPFGQIRRTGFDDPSSAGGFLRTFLGFVSTSEDDPYIEADLGDLDDGAQSHETLGGWIGFNQQYFLSAWIPQVDANNRYTMRRNNNGQYFGEFTSSAFTVEPGETGDYPLHYYVGPKDKYALAAMAPNLDLTIDYSWLWFIAEPIYWLLTQINSLIGNYGISIILLTIVVKSLFYKLSETQYRSMAGMRRLMPKMQQLKESYGDDKMKLQKATMDLYKKEKINPFGGCLPMLVQMPVFIALYWVLLESVELRHAPFFLWLTDLSVRDPFFVLPLLMGATMYLQTTLSPTPADPMQANVMKFMPIMMTLMFLWFPAGLVLYWLTNGLLGILQQWYITRKLDAAHEAKKAASS